MVDFRYFHRYVIWQVRERWQVRELKQIDRSKNTRKPLLVRMQRPNLRLNQPSKCLWTIYLHEQGLFFWFLVYISAHRSTTLAYPTPFIYISPTTPCSTRVTIEKVAYYVKTIINNNMGQVVMEMMENKAQTTAHTLPPPPPPEE